jgi:hypothetical protein
MGKSVRIKEDLAFFIDDDTKTLALSEGTRLRVTRFDASRISAEGTDIQYELNRSDNSLTYAGSTTQDSTTTIIIGSGQCKAAPSGKANRRRILIRVGARPISKRETPGASPSQQHR